MCELAMPGMVDRKSGVVINISSAAAVIPSPMLTVYAATKVIFQIIPFCGFLFKLFADYFLIF